MDQPRLNALIPELYCRHFTESVAFYTDVLGFKILYAREEETFAMIERDGAQIMLDQYVPESARPWIAGPLEHPWGRGINLEMHVTDVDALYQRVQRAKAPAFLPLEEKWYRADNVFLGVRQFIVLDPDGYLLRFSQSLGARPVEKEG